MATRGRRRSVRLKENKTHGKPQGISILDKCIWRENETVSKFLMQDLTWSPWQLSICKRKQDRRSLVKRPTSGYKFDQIFDGKYDEPALYEFAVQIKPKTKKHVVFAKQSSGFKQTPWEKSLLGNSVVQQQINNVLSYGCDVYVRRTLLKTKEDYVISKKSRAMYDYPWCDSRGTGKHRKVFKGQVPISLEFQENYKMYQSLFALINKKKDDE